tara:strand:- start:10642 stop:11433 length:792 start_codon:yes stop_codon:yes gene_type:complete
MPTITGENLRLVLYDYNYESYDNRPLRSFHNGHTGDSQEHLFFVRNHNSSKWYTNIQLTPVVIGGYDDRGEFGTTGWGVKLMYGRRRPTEEEWDYVKTGSTIIIPDIGTCEAADTFTNHPIWARIYCPGGEAAQIRENMQIKIKYSVKEVGSCSRSIRNMLTANQATGSYEENYDGPYAVYGTSILGVTAGNTGYYYPLYITEASANLADNAADGEQSSHVHSFSQYEGVNFYMPDSDMNHYQSSNGGYPIYGTDLGSGYDSE